MDLHHAVCSYCRIPFGSVREVVYHCCTTHQDEKVSYMWEANNAGNVVYKHRTFNVTGIDVGDRANNVKIDPISGKLMIPTQTNVTDSPLRKLQKINTPSKSVHCQIFHEKQTASCDTVDDISEQLEDTLLYSDSEFEELSDLDSDDLADGISNDNVLGDNESVQMAVRRLKVLLPSVTNHLAEIGRLEDWVTFFHLVDNGEFSANHISAQLFFDVVKFANIQDIRNMRYTPEVKQFWTIGYSLFKAKFSRFMGGYKVLSRTDEHDDNTDGIMNKSDMSMLNFVVPNRDALKEEKKRFKIDCNNPGIIWSNIEAVAAGINCQTKAYNLCVDGKKIAAGFGSNLGDVDLFGHESDPTYSSKKNRLEVEEQVFTGAMVKIRQWMDRDIDSISDLIDESKSFLYINMLDILSINSERLKEMRRLKVSRQLSLDKLMTIASEPWQKSRYSFAISSIKTQIYDINRCINDVLELNSKFGLIAAACNGAEYNFPLDSVVELKYQDNYVCLNEANAQIISDDSIPTKFIKQRTEQWHCDRKLAKATGSTLFQAVGLDTLKKQQEHFDKVHGKGKDTVSASNPINEAMRHGSENEINGIGTIVARILPIFLPQAKFHEEGYYKMAHDADPNFLVVSPDGSCRVNDDVKYAVEIKCPLPGKKFTTDVHYEIPKYYVTQILAEMAALECEKLLYVSWTPESATVMRVTFDEKLWHLILSELHAVYSNPNGAMRPTKKQQTVSQLLQDIKLFAINNVELLCEIPSVKSVQCCHSGNIDQLTISHNRKEMDDAKLEKETEEKNRHSSMEAILTTLSKGKTCVTEAYNILRTPAKEVLVAVLSDLDRQYGPNSVHGIPVAYGLSGYSLKVQSMRSLMEEIIGACYKSGISVKSLSTDGQFYRLCVRDKQDRPLTVLQLAKDSWETVKKMTKSEQVCELMELNYEKHESIEDVCNALETDLLTREGEFAKSKHGSITVAGWKKKAWPKLYNPRRLTELVSKKPKCQTEKMTINNSDLDNMPAEAANNLSDEIVDEVIYMHDVNVISESSQTERTTSNRVHLSESTEDDQTTAFTDDQTMAYVEDLIADTPTSRIDLNGYSEEFIQEMLSSVSKFDKDRKKSKWTNVKSDQFKAKLEADPAVLMRVFSKPELFTCSEYFRETIEHVTGKQIDRLTKLELANAFSLVFGPRTVLGTKKSPPKLRRILKDLLSKGFSKEALNAIIATRKFLENDLPMWRQTAAFKNGVYLGASNRPFVWYSQPEYFENVENYIVYLLDCHHLFVNARSYVCQHGIKDLKVNKDAWIKVAESKDSAECGLNIAMVRDIIDKQSNAIAQIVFSEKVEWKMNELGWTEEASFCKCIREWYKAEDEAGLNVDTRHSYRMNMRDMLLNSVNLADFPPPGSHIAGMPVVMFEGILTNIDRRYQLHALVPGNAYNVRAPNTLAVENLFGGFQDLDPKSTGVLMADDIPHALETASYLIQSRLDPDRPFEMRTAKSSRVYPSQILHKPSTTGEVMEPLPDVPTSRTALQKIPVEPHPFDLVQAKKNRRRKKANIPDYRMPSRGSQPVRQYHKTDSSKILPHVRHGLTFDT